MRAPLVKKGRYFGSVPTDPLGADSFDRSDDVFDDYTAGEAAAWYLIVFRPDWQTALSSVGFGARAASAASRACPISLPTLSHPPPVLLHRPRPPVAACRRQRLPQSCSHPTPNHAFWSTPAHLTSTQPLFDTRLPRTSDPPWSDLPVTMRITT